MVKTVLLILVLAISMINCKHGKRNFGCTKQGGYCSDSNTCPSSGGEVEKLSVRCKCGKACCKCTDTCPDGSTCMSEGETCDGTKDTNGCCGNMFCCTPTPVTTPPPCVPDCSVPCKDSCNMGEDETGAECCGLKCCAIMMKCCCLIVFTFLTIDVSNGGILSGICLASNGTCGKRGVPCKETFGSEWTYNGKCCNNRPCCKFLKTPCVPETCPKGFKLLSNQTSSANCYRSDRIQVNWNTAADNCASTDGAYLWRPNTEQEANDVQNEFNIHTNTAIWTGANDQDKDGTFTFAIENGPFSINDPPFGKVGVFVADEVCVMIGNLGAEWRWFFDSCTINYHRYICEYKLRVCP